MCVKESLYRAMGITLTVSLRMMFDVRCCPLKSRTFPRHGTKDEQNTLDDGMGTEAAMGQHTMITHRYTQRNKSIHCYQWYQIGPINGSLPEQSYSEYSSEQGNDNHCKHDRFVNHAKSQENLHLYVLHCTSGTLVGVVWGGFCFTVLLNECMRQQLLTRLLLCLCDVHCLYLA